MGLCVSVIIELVVSANNISPDILMIFSLYIYPFLLIINICQKNNFKFWQFVKPVKFRPLKEMILPIIMAEILNFGIMFLIASVIIKFSAGISFDDADVAAIRWNPIMSFLTLVVFAPFFEEVVFRWYLFHKLAVKKTPIKAMILSSLIFGILHLENVVPTTIIGIILCMVFVKYKSLFPCIIIHLSHNILVFLFQLNTQGTTNTNMETELPDAGMLLLLAAVSITFSLIWFRYFWKNNVNLIRNNRAVED